MNAVEEFFNPTQPSASTSSSSASEQPPSPPSYSSSYQVAPPSPVTQPTASVDPFVSLDDTSEWATVDWKTFAIAFLCFLLFLVVLRVDVVELVAKVARELQRFIGWILRSLGYTTGTVIAGGAHIATTGVEIVGSAVEEAGEVIADTAKSYEPSSSDASTPGENEKRDSDKDKDKSDKDKGTRDDGFDLTARSYRKVSDRQAAPIRRIRQDDMASSAQHSSKRGGWCLAGIYGGKRGCAAVDDDRLCTSGKLYASKEACSSGDV